MPNAATQTRSARSLLRDAARTLRAGGARLVGFLLLSQLVIALVGLPLIGWLFRELLRANGMTAVDLQGFGSAGAWGLSLSLLLIAVIGVVAFWLIALQFTALCTLLESARAGRRPPLRQSAAELARVARKLLRPSSLPLQLYLFVVMPLSGFGFTSALSQGISLPPFVSGELLKSGGGTALFIAFMLLMVLLNLRFAAAVPIFALTDATGGAAMRRSWRATGGRRGLALAGAIALLLLRAGAASLALAFAAMLPTVIADAVAPGAAVLVAAGSLGAAHTIGIFIVGLTTAGIAAVLLALVAAPGEPAPAAAAAQSRPARGPGPRDRRAGWAVAGLAVAMSVAAAIPGAGAIRSLSEAPETLVIAHRGFPDGGVENTIGGLDAAQAAGADLVEMDVMQTADGGFAAIHDPNLTRLAGIDADVADLALDELVGTTVRAGGFTDEIPSFADYARHAHDIGMPLLVEIKLHGGETDDHVERLVDELDGLGLLEENIYHSLDRASVARLKELRPDLTVGYTMPFTGVSVPDTPADFIVAEEWSASQRVQDATAASGRGFMAWTVNEEPGMRQFMRRDVDGLITDRPDLAVRVRAELGGGTGVAERLADALDRFVTGF